MIQIARLGGRLAFRPHPERCCGVVVTCYGTAAGLRNPQVGVPLIGTVAVHRDAVRDVVEHSERLGRVEQKFTCAGLNEVALGSAASHRVVGSQATRDQSQAVVCRPSCWTRVHERDRGRCDMEPGIGQKDYDSI